MKAENVFNKTCIQPCARQGIMWDNNGIKVD